MGKSPNPKPKGRPDHVLQSGESEAGPDVAVVEMLDIWLEKIDPAVHAQTSIGDTVTVGHDDLSVSTSLGVLGAVPRSKASALLKSGFLSGFVLNLTHHPLGVQVRLS